MIQFLNDSLFLCVSLLDEPLIKCYTNFAVLSANAENGKAYFTQFSIIKIV